MCLRGSGSVRASVVQVVHHTGQEILIRMCSMMQITSKHGILFFQIR